MSEEKKTVELKEDELNQIAAGGSNPLVDVFEEYYCTICGYVFSRKEIDVGTIAIAYQACHRVETCPICNDLVTVVNRVVYEKKY